MSGRESKWVREKDREIQTETDGQRERQSDIDRER